MAFIYRLFCLITAFSTPLLAASSGAAAVLPAAETRVAAQVWSTSYAVSQARARELKRPLLLLFTGSDWCMWSQRLRSDVLMQPEFIQFAEADLILVSVDFPQKIRLPLELKRQNRALAKTYHVDTYPTVVLVDVAGRELGRSGFTYGGARTFVRMLQEWKASKGAKP